MKFFEWLRQRAGGRTAGGDLTTAFVGHAAEKACAALAGLVLIAGLTPSEYGVYVGAMAILAIAGRVADLGLDTATARAVSRGRREGTPGEEELLGAVLLAKAGLAAGAFALLVLLAPLITRALDRAWMTPFVQLAAVGLFGRQLQGVYKASFAGRLQFGRNAAYLVLGPCILLVSLGAAAAFGRLTVPLCLAFAAGAPLLSVLLVTAAVGRPLLRRPWRHVGRLREVLGFGRWIYATDVLATLRGRLGSLMLLRLSTSEAAGIYGAADALASGVSIIGSTMHTVLIPRTARLRTRGEFRAFLRKSYVLVGLLLLIAPAALLVPWLGRPVVEAVAPQYLAALPAFSVIFMSILFTIARWPSSTVLYAVGKPHVETAIEILAVTLTVVLMLALVPHAEGLSRPEIARHGSMGAALAMLVQRAVSSGLVMAWVFANVYRGGDEREGVAAPAVARGTEAR